MMKANSAILAALLIGAASHNTQAQTAGGALFLSTVPDLAPSNGPSNVQIEVDGLGLKSLKWKGREFLVRGSAFESFRLRGATLEAADGKVSSLGTEDTRHTEANSVAPIFSFVGPDQGASLQRTFPANIGVRLQGGKLITHDFSFSERTFVNGSGELSHIETLFTPIGDDLQIATTITNTSDQVIRGADIQLATLQFPSQPQGFDGDPRLNPNRDAPALLEAASSDAKDDWQALVENQTPARPLIWGFPYSIDKPANRTYPLIISTRGVNWLGNLLDPYIDKPLLPGASEHIKIVLHFGTRAQIAQVKQQVLARYARQFPPLLKWDDRRPIGMVMLSTSEAQFHSQTNPRGWFNDATLDISNAADFKKRILDRAREVVRVSKSNNSQGVIVWDLEGQEFPHATSYLGDPRSLPPEIEAVADAFFKILRDGGLKVGLCVRPQLPVRAAYGPAVGQIESSNPAQTLIDKIGYARKRWGATLFYVDSNGDPNVPFPAQIFEQVLAAQPDILLIPEHQSARYYRATAPYDELRGGISGTPADVREIYPRAFSVIVVSDGDVGGKRAELVRSVRNGDILMSRVWWDDPFNAEVRSIYAEARR